jgi:hypothetical protein
MIRQVALLNLIVASDHDRAFNRVRDRLHRMYEDDDLDRFVDEEAA